MGELRGRVVEVRGPETVMHIPSNAKFGLLNYVKILRIVINHLDESIAKSVEREPMPRCREASMKLRPHRRRRRRRTKIKEGYDEGARKR